MNWLLSIFKSVGRYLAAATETRDVVIRHRGAVKHLTISRWVQIPVFVALVGFLGWFAHVSVIYHGYDAIIKAKNEDLARAISHNRSLTGKVSDMQSDITDVAGTLKKSHHNLVNLITQNDNFNAALKKLKAELKVSERKRGEQLRRQAALNAQLRGSRSSSRKLKNIQLVLVGKLMKLSQSSPPHSSIEGLLSALVIGCKNALTALSSVSSLCVEPKRTHSPR